MASARRTTDTQHLLPRGTAPQAWPRFQPSLLPRSPRPPHLTLQILLQPHHSPKLQPQLLGLWTRVRPSALPRWHPRPPPQTAPSAPLPVSAVTLTVKGTAARTGSMTHSRMMGTRVQRRTAAPSTAPAPQHPPIRRRASTVTAATVSSSDTEGLPLHQQVEIMQKCGKSFVCA